VAQALSWNGVIGLGEVMNFPGVVANDPKMHAEISLPARQVRLSVGITLRQTWGVLFMLTPQAVHKTIMKAPPFRMPSLELVRA
jgi:hypothetical protein